MKTLIVSFKVDDTSVYKDKLLDEDVFYYGGICKLNKQFRIRNVYKIVGFLVACSYFILNRIICEHNGTDHNSIFSLIKRNKFNEIIIAHIITAKQINILEIHWVGYGFLPRRSILEIQKRTNIEIRIINHDWRNFTGGCHVPSDCDMWAKKCVSCPRTRRNINLSSYYFDNSSNEAELQDVLVSESQKAKLHTIQFPYPEGFIIEQNRPTDQLEMISKNKRNKGPLLVGFVGVIAGNNDNKGLEISVRICRELKSPKVMFLGVACSKDLQVDISFSRLANKDLQNVFDLLDVLIVPSKLETFSMVSYEAVSTGCQVICRGGLAPTTWGSPLIASPEIASDEGLFEFVKGKILNA